MSETRKCRKPPREAPKSYLQALHKAKMDMKRLRNRERPEQQDLKRSTANVGRNHDNYGKHPKDAYLG